MNMDEKTIKEALLKGERVTLECKKAQSNIPRITRITGRFFDPLKMAEVRGLMFDV